MKSPQHIWYACQNDLDLVLDDIIDQYSVAPDLELIEQGKQVCHWCQQPAEYILTIEQEESEPIHEN
ncbi:CxxH/CxxC protein [Hazenella coriacea]|uniref:CxxH/CxxC protein (TIGR04129 family) n=1 Tax=Hazenella coriacea TaxID=1179467 RepID=A0A4R3LB41_9BACL|nr:CxxH/CxxC protein [Hazenella coriacea]TCS95514.1 CxxH/CxxC protein (TIGR04129 family) [Hazenella coriacea]